MKLIKLNVLLIVSSLALISCSSGGGGSDDEGISYSGKTTEATIEDSNADQLALASTGGGGMAVNSENAPISFRSSSPSSDQSSLEDLSAKILQSLNATANRTANQPQDISATMCDQGGDATVTTSNDGNSATILFENCRTLIDLEVFTINGRAVMTVNPNDNSFSIDYQNFRMSVGGESFTFDGNIACDSGATSCTVSLDFVGLDDRVYRLQNLTIASTGPDSFSISARVYDPDHGYVTISGNVTYGSCDYAVPSSGSINFNGASGSYGSITFNDCDSFTVSENGVADPAINWSDVL